MSQNSGDYRNNPRQAPLPRRDDSDSPGLGPDYSVPSLIFDEYGEVKANPQPRLAPPPLQTGNQRDQGEAPSVPSLIFDEFGELKPSALNALKPAQPLPNNQPVAQPRFNQPAPVQPSPARQALGRPTNINQGQAPYVAPIPVAPPAPVMPGPSTPNTVVKNGGIRIGMGLWLTLGAVVAGMLIGLVLFVVLNKPVTPAPSTSATPVSLSGLFPFTALTPGTAIAGVTTPGATVSSASGDLDALYNQATAQLKNNQFKEAAATLEQLRDKQNQSGNLEHPDVPALLFRAYLSLGDQLNKAPQFADFQQSLVNYQKAIDTAKTLDAEDRNQQEETALQTRLDIGNLYVKAVTAYNQKDLDAAIKIFSQLYARDQNFRDASNLYYDSLIRIGDGQFAENLLPEAYQSYGRAAQIKNVADTRYAQARMASIETQLRQAGKPVPTVPAP